MNAEPHGRAGPEEGASAPFNLLRSFTGAALAVLVVVSLIAGGAAVGLVRGAFLDMEKDEADSIAEDVTGDLVRGGFGPDRWGSEPVPDALRAQVIGELRNFNAVEMVFFDAGGGVLMAFAPASAATRPPWPDALAAAWRGSAHPRWEASGWWPVTGAIETYVPIRAGGRVVAAARVRRDLAAMLGPAEAILPRLYVMGFGVGLAVFVALWLLVRRADRLLKRQHALLEEARSQVEARNRLLEELNRRKDAFYGMASDDLHAPLLAVRDGLQVLLSDGKESLNPFQREVVGENLRVTEAALDLVENLLDLTRIEEDEEPDRREPVDLVSVVRGVVATSQGLAASREVRLDVATPSGPVEVSGDRLKLVRAVNILVSQSIKHAASRPVEIVLEAEGSEARLTVRNQGLGFPPEHLAVLFDPERAAGEIPEDVLHEFAVLRGHVEGHGGTVRVESVFGEGMTLRVALPLAGAAVGRG